MLHNPPRLIFYSAYTAAVEVNNMDPNIAKKTAGDILSYIQAYINEYHPDLVEYVRYGMDHSNTYQKELLECISQLFNSNCHDETLRTALTTQAGTHNSTNEGSIRYVSTHSIGFRDIIDKKATGPLFNSLDQNGTNVQSYEEIDFPDCIISVGGSVEERFGRARHIIRQAFTENLQSSSEYHSPLSIRMLSKAGHKPVYYCLGSDEITFDYVLTSATDDLYQMNKMHRDVRNDLSIIVGDISVRILKAMLEGITTNEPAKMPSLEIPVSSLTDLCWEIFKKHANDENPLGESLQITHAVVTQLFEYYGLPNNVGDHARSITYCIMDCLETQERKREQKQEKNRKRRDSRIQYAINNPIPRPRSDSAPLTCPLPDQLRPRRDSLFTINSATNDASLLSDSMSSTNSAINDRRRRTDSMSSTNSAVNDPHPRTDSMSSTNSASTDPCSHNDNQSVSPDTRTRINTETNSIFCKIFVAFIKEFGKKPE